jgi:AraC-like DNA-binding protein
MISSALRRFGDPEAFQSFIRAGEAQVFVSARGEYQGEVTRIDLPHIWMQRFRQSLPTLVYVKLDDARVPITFGSDERQCGITHAGAELGPGELACSAVGDEHHIRLPKDAILSACSFTREDLAFFGRALTGRELRAPPVNRVLSPKAHLTSRLRSVHGAAVSLATNTPDVLAIPEVAKAVEQALIQAAIACLADLDEMAAARASPASNRAMRRLEELLEAKQDEPLYIPEICAAVGIGERTLRAYCHEHLGISPHRYLWLRRMNMAQRALMRADMGATTVTEIATQYGFGELGRFAVSYRTLFGESPSATLGRQRR